MKKVLIIAYFFNQDKEIGSLRSKGLYKYLNNFGWEPIILTTCSSNYPAIKIKNKNNIIEMPFEDKISKWKKIIGLNSNEAVSDQLDTSKANLKGKLFIKLIYYFKEFFLFPDPQNNWIKLIRDDGIDIIKAEKIDAIISTSPPVTSHLIAARLKKELNIPWIADLRDLWTQYHYYEHSNIRKKIETNLEKKILQNANILTTTTSYFELTLKELHENKKIYTINNGFDPEKINNIPNLSKKFTILYSGLLYNGKRNPEFLFKAINELNEKNLINITDFQIEFYTDSKKWLLKKIKEYNLQKIVFVHEMIPRDEILKKQWSSQLLLLLTWNHPEELGVIPGKVFEYLAARRPILSFGEKKGPLYEIIDSSNAGFQSNDYEELKNEIKRLYDEYDLNKFLEYKGNEKQINCYSQKEMAKKFADALNSIT